MTVMSALVLSVLLGLACTWTNAVTITNLLEEFQKIVLQIVTRVSDPAPACIYRFYLLFAFPMRGRLPIQLPVFLQVVLIVVAGHYLWMAVLYIAAGIYSRSNPLDVIWNYGPAYITAIGTMSSAATLGGGAAMCEKIRTAAQR